MNIGIVCYPTFGGSGVVATELGKALAGYGHTVHFITYDRPVRLNHFAQNIYYHQVTPAQYPLFDFVPYESALISKLVDVSRYHRLDILHVHYAIPHASSAFFAQQILHEMGIQLPFITTLHGTDSTLVGINASYEPVVTFSLNRSNGITCVSDHLRDITLNNFGIHRPIEVIPNFIDLNRFKPVMTEAVTDCFSAEGEKILMHVSNFRPVKRVPDTVEVFQRVRQQIRAKLVLVGDGPERSIVEQRVRKYGLQQEVCFLGRQEMIEQILPAADVFLLPSESESFGLAALEALACGVPVVCSKAGGLPEVVVSGQSGELSPVGNYDQMAEGVLRIVSDPDRYHSYSRGALDRAEEFSQEKVVPEYIAFYERICSGEAVLSS